MIGRPAAPTQRISELVPRAEMDMEVEMETECESESGCSQALQTNLSELGVGH